MSTALSEALSSLQSALLSEVPSHNDLKVLEAIVVQAHQAKFRAEADAARVEAQAQFATVQARLAEQLAAAQLSAEARLTEALNYHVEGLSSNQQPATSNQQPATSNQPLAAKSVNARFANLNAGLNDRLAFVKHLFGGDDQDYQRVVAYLSTLESKMECETFVREAVQPEYDWSKCPDVADRFMKLVYARFE